MVVGAARSGIAAAELLARRGARVTLTDTRTSVEDDAALRAHGVALELGGHAPAMLGQADLVVLSPGVDPLNPVLDEARARLDEASAELAHAQSMDVRDRSSEVVRDRSDTSVIVGLRPASA